MRRRCPAGSCLRRLALCAGLLLLVPAGASANPGAIVQPGVRLTPSDLIAAPGEAGMFGYTLELSADGSTAVIGAPYSRSQNGQVWIFARSASGWTQQGPAITPSNENGGNLEFGSSVAISGNGDTVLIGGVVDSTTHGAAWIFTRSGTSWSQQAELSPTDADVGSLVGTSAALSADGNTALLGGSGDANYVGAAWIFTRSGSTWTQQGAKLTANDEVGEAGFGRTAAMSADGKQALIGGFGDNGQAGAVWAFANVAGVWLQQGAKLTPTDEIGAGDFGVGIALTPDGTSAVIGGSADNSNLGAAWVFTRSGSVWSQQGSKLVPNDIDGIGYVGYGVGVAPDGASLVVGGNADANGVGAIWTFARQGGAWSQVGTKQTVTNADPSENFGLSVAISADTVLVGAIGDGGGSGAVWAYHREQSPAPVATSGGTKPDLLTTFTTDVPHVAVGDGLVYRVTVSDKAGSGGASAVKVTVELPAGVTLLDTYTDRGPGCTGTTHVVCDIAWISPGVDGHVILRAKAAGAGSLVASASSREDEPDATPGDNTASTTVLVDGPQAETHPVSPSEPQLGVKIEGTPAVGKKLVASSWTLAGVDASSVSYRWQLCDVKGCRAIAGESRRSLLVRRTFRGGMLRVSISATIAGVRRTAVSATTARIR